MKGRIPSVRDLSPYFIRRYGRIDARRAFRAARAVEKRPAYLSVEGVLLDLFGSRTTGFKYLSAGRWLCRYALPAQQSRA